MKHYRVEFIYRVCSRVIEGQQLEKMRDSLSTQYPTIVFSPGENLFWPITPNEIEDYRARGILLTEKDSTMCVVIQELGGHIPVTDYASGDIVADSLLTSYPKSFASVSVVAERRPEVHAV